LEVVNNGGSTVAVKLYDAPSTNFTWSRGAYTNWTTYTTNIAVVTSDYNGVSITNTYAATYTLPNAVSSGTANYKLLKTFSVAAGESATWEPTGGVFLSYGLACTNSVTNTVINWSYSNIR
jgi:uncharacterized membrane protein